MALACSSLGKPRPGVGSVPVSLLSGDVRHSVLAGWKYGAQKQLDLGGISCGGSRAWLEKRWQKFGMEVSRSDGRACVRRPSIGQRNPSACIFSEMKGGTPCSSWLNPGVKGGRPAGAGFVALDSSGERRGGRLRTQASKADGDGFLRLGQETIHLVVSLGIFIGLDKVLKQGFSAAGVRFPSALFGMFCLFALLTILDSIRPSAATSVVSFFQPANIFIQRWLPLFYVPSLVMVPLAVKGIPASEGAKMALILVGGWVTTLAVAGYTAVTVRRIVKTDLKPSEPTLKPAPFSSFELKSWVCGLLLSFALAVLFPTALGAVSVTVMPFFISATVVGYMTGSSLPAGIRKIFHPIIVCAASADLAAFLFGTVTGLEFDTALGAYLTKSSSQPGAGDVLMGFLGSVILSFAFSMYKQRKLVQRHAAEIFSSVVASSLYGLYATAAVGRLLGLDKSFIAAIIPRSITVALALPIASLLEATNISLTAACVVLTGLIGANFSQVVMDKLGLNDPISRGMATASSGHGLGTAALSAKEPEALPFCAIAYALTGIFSSIICAIPIVRESLLAVAGG